MTNPIRGIFQVQFTAKSPFNRMEAVLAILPGSTVAIISPATKGYVVVFRFPWEGKSEGDLAAAVDRYSQEVGRIVKYPTSTFFPDEPQPPTQASPNAIVVRGVVIAANVDGGPLDGTHLRIEKPSSKYPWRMCRSEGAHSGHKAVWDLPLDGVSRDAAGALLGSPVRITIERDPDAKFS